MSEAWIAKRLATDSGRKAQAGPDEDDRQAAILALNPSRDARNRALRTLIQVVAVEVVVVLAPLLLAVLDNGLSWADVGRGGVRAVMAAALAWAMRRRFPPPAPSG